MLEVRAPERELGSNISLVHAVKPAADRGNTVKHDGHPPRSTAGLQFPGIFRRCQICSWRVAPLCARKGAWVIEMQRNCDPSLKSCKYPDLNPSSFLVKEPRQDDTSLHDWEDILTGCHSLVDIRPGFVHVKISKTITPCTVGKRYDVM